MDCENNVCTINMKVNLVGRDRYCHNHLVGRQKMFRSLLGFLAVIIVIRVACNSEIIKMILGDISKCITKGK